MSLIDADALMKSIGCEEATKYGNKTTEQRNNSYSTMMMYEIANMIDDAPTIEAEPVRHGTWVWVKDHWECSRCRGSRHHDISLGLDAAYCGRCGTKMDGGGER